MRPQHLHFKHSPIPVRWRNLIPLKHPVYDQAVTICIAAISGSNIVLCSDSRLSYEWGGTDAGDKVCFLGSGWCAMLAGQWRMVNRLADHYRSYLSQTSIDPDGLVEQMKRPLRDFRRSLMDDETTKYGMSIDQFLAAKNLPQSMEAEIYKKFQSINIGCELLLTGFVNHEPYIIRVGSDSSGNDSVSVEQSFAAIGTGAFIASMILDQRGYRPSATLQEALYFVYEAKKFSEKADGVNQLVRMSVHYPNDHTWPVGKGPAMNVSGAVLDLISSEGERFLEKLYRRFSLRSFVEHGDLPPDLFFSEERINEFLNRPNVVSDPSLHGGGDS